MSDLQKTFQQIYDEMRDRNIDNIRQNGIKFDAVITERTPDKRKGLLLCSFFDPIIPPEYKEILSALDKDFPNQIIYSPSPINNQGLLHFTFLQIFKVLDEDISLTDEDLAKYLQAITPILFEMDPFKLDYSGVMAIPTGLLAYAYPSINVNYFRENIRVSLDKNKLESAEPYKANITHSTLMRLCQSEEREKILAFAQRYRDFSIGSLLVEKMYLGYGTWKMQKHETEYKYVIDLKNKIYTKL